MKANFVVLVTAISGNVGQGILRCLKQRFPGFKIIGCDIGSLTAGHRYCDAFYQVPYSYEPGYAEIIPMICQQESVDLVIPATDYEVFYLGKIMERLPTLIATPPSDSWTFIDKLETWRAFQKFNIPFAESCLPADYHHDFEEIIVKPREGRGSRGIHINPDNLSDFDNSYMVQKLYKGLELTTAIYVRQDCSVHGMITFERSLVAGATERCQVTSVYDDSLMPIAADIAKRFNLKGPCNIQSIATDTGKVIPFEINCRYSGTTSIRAQLGFPDVVFGVQEYLLGVEPEPSNVTAGSAIRILLDIIYAGKTLAEIKPGECGVIF